MLNCLSCDRRMGPLAKCCRGRLISFDNRAFGIVPPGWEVHDNQRGGGPWEVLREEAAPSRPERLSQDIDGVRPASFPTAML